MERYHMRRPDREMKDSNEILDVLKKGSFMTIAMCKNNEPYLTSMDYVYSSEENCIYFHCAKEGKKIDYLKANPNIWGEVVVDNGYIDGKCSHAYKSVHFKGKAKFVEDDEEMRHALLIMIDKCEKEPEKMKKEFITSSTLRLAVVRIDLLETSGKKNEA